MAAVEVEYRHYIGNPGELADAYSVEFADPTNSWGVQRKDNNDIVVPAGTTLVKQSTGVYFGSWEDPAPGLTYRYFLKIVSGGVTYYNERETSLNENFYDYDSRYSSYSNLTRKYGKVAIHKWASVDGRVDVAFTRAAIEDALQSADAYIDTYLNGGPYVVPFEVDSVPRIIRECATMLAASLLYEAQGIIDFDPETEPFNRMAGEHRKAIVNLGRIKTGRVRLLTDAGVDLLQSVTVPEAGDSIYTNPYWYLTDDWIE
jgi:phage gp36-like protein